MWLTGGIGFGGIVVMLIIDVLLVRVRDRMAREYHIAAVGGSNDDEVSVYLADVLNALGAQDCELKAAIPGNPLLRARPCVVI
jgi:hypothetical protein